MDIRRLIEANLGQEPVRELVPGRILAVDDDEGNLVVLQELLEERYQVAVTTSPAEALALAREREFDMVIADQRMPGMTGVELLKAVREAHPDTVRMIISAYSDVSAILEAVNEGEVYRFVLKPWDPDDLMAAVGQGLERRLHTLAIRRLAEVLHDRNERLEAAFRDLKEAQERLLHAAKLATLGQLTAGIAHELKNHLSGVRLLLEVVQDAELPPELADCVALGHDSAQALFDLVMGLNAFARKGSGELVLAPGSIREVVERTVRLVKADLRWRQRETSLELEDELPPVMMDADRIRQVLVNLLRNALDATQKDGRVAVCAQADGETIVVGVRDDGTGMPEEVRRRLFEPFFTTKEGGLGLGLQISRQLIEAHGGKLEVASVQGEGTTVSIRLPIARRDPGEAPG